MFFRALLICLAVYLPSLTSSGLAETHEDFYFPPPGESISMQRIVSPAEAGLSPKIVSELGRLVEKRWALWRNGYLVHLEGDFNQTSEVKSLRKTWHALTVGAAITLGRIPSLSQKISVWLPELEGQHVEATWWHVMTQTSGFDYPYAEYPAYAPGEIWTYSDKNPKYLCQALARVFGNDGYENGYERVLEEAYFDRIGMRGWSLGVREDGIRLYLDLEDMGRLGLLALSRGRWGAEEVIHSRFIDQLDRKQTDEIQVNYQGPDDGTIELDSKLFQDAPYGFMTWVNTDRDFYPGADRHWAWAAGAGGYCIFWNQKLSIVLAGVGVQASPSAFGIPHIIEDSIIGPNPFSPRTQHGGSRSSTSNSTLQTDLQQPKELGHLGEFPKWAPVEIELPGPHANSESSPNPFGILVDVNFEGPGGRRFRVPAFYDGDGEGNPEGTVWKVRFSADKPGRWRFSSGSFHPQLNGYRGSFVISEISADARGFYRLGRLESVATARNGIRYLKFRDGPYWMKAGCDDPENFLGKAEHFDTPEERLKAIDYLASKGVNSLYIMTHNLGGDDKDVWPWLGSTAELAMMNGGSDARFDIPKLHEWRELFTHMQNAGVVPYIVLEDDSAWTGYDHPRYYREMIARFGDLPAVMFNLGEEHNENYTLEEALAFMQQLAHIDPFGHPRGIHNVNHPDVRYVEATHIDFTSIQTRPETPLTHNKLTSSWLDLCAARFRRPLMVSIDEGRPEEQRLEWWQTYLGGGVWEVHVMPPYDRPLSSWEVVWTELGGTRAFMESFPFWEMTENNSLVTSGNAFCLAKPPYTYALYLPEGGEIVVDLHPDFSYRVGWWNPANGIDGEFENGGSIRGGRQMLRAPGGGDWALKIERK